MFFLLDAIGSWVRSKALSLLYDYKDIEGVVLVHLRIKRRQMGLETRMTKRLGQYSDDDSLSDVIGRAKNVETAHCTMRSRNE